MTEPSIPSMQIVALFEEQSCFMDIKVKNAGGNPRCLRCELDPITYENLKEVASPELLSLGAEGLECSLSLSSCPEPGKEHVIWNTYGKQSTFTFQCSTEFQVLLNNLRNDSGIEDIVGLAPGYEIKTKSPSPSILGIRSVLIALCCFIFILITPGAFGDGQGDATGSYEHEMKVMENVALPVSTFDPEDGIDNQLEAGSIIFSVKSGEVALTFDDGPSPNTMRILDILRQHEIKATFFFIGKQVEQYPEAVAKVINQGSVVGWHSKSHVNMNNLSKLVQEQEILSCIEASSSPDHKITLFRPPYGSYNKHTKEILAAHGMTMVLWNKDPKDWKAPNPDEIIRYVFSTDPSRSIYDLHETQVTVNALPVIIKELKSRGFKFVTLTPPHHVQGIDEETI